MTEEILKKALTSERAIKTLGIPAKVISRGHSALEFVRRKAYIVAADSLDADADFRTVAAHVGTDDAALKYAADRISIAAKTLLEGLVK